MLSSDIVLRDRCERWQRWCQWKWWFCYGARQNCKQTTHKNWMVSKMPFHFHDHVVQFSLGSMIILLGMLLAVSSVLFARVHYFFCKHWNHFVYVHLICSFVCLFVYSILCFRTLAHSHTFAFPMSFFMMFFFDKFHCESTLNSKCGHLDVHISTVVRDNPFLHHLQPKDQLIC